MALITKITHQALQTQSGHMAVECTYDVVTDAQGNRHLQLDTYGSKDRQIPGKKSQSIRLSPSALAELKQIIRQHGL